MAKTHYDVLSVGRKATQAEIKAAYRKLVLAHHPDRSSDPRSKDLFLAGTAAYETLSDPEARKRYDILLDLESRRAAEAARPKAQAAHQARPTAPRAPAPKASPPKTAAPGQPKDQKASTAQEVARMTGAFARGRFDEAERLAKKIIEIDSRQPMPYAILGDIARSRRNLNEAVRMYAFAVQMDPRNPTYQRQYERLLTSSRIQVGEKKATLEPDDAKVLAPMGATVVVLVCAAYVALSHETALAPSVGLISSWTLGLVVMLFFAGVSVGCALSLGNLIDRFDSFGSAASGKTPPALALGSVAVVNFWAAAALYAILGLTQRVFNYSSTRMMGAVGASVGIIALASSAGRMQPEQVMLWGGNVSYVGALCGWLVTDSIRG